MFARVVTVRAGDRITTLSQGSEVLHVADQDSTDMMKALDRIQQQETVRRT
jgi:thiamine pyrophosphokinase